MFLTHNKSFSRLAGVHPICKGCARFQNCKNEEDTSATSHYVQWERQTYKQISTMPCAECRDVYMIYGSTEE